MCLGKTHLIGGLALGFGAADLYGSLVHPLSLPAVLACGVLSAGSAMLNDLDTPSSTVSHSMGEVSQSIAKGVQWLSKTAFNMTATPADLRYASPVHRALTHTFVFALVMGFLTTGLASFGLFAVAGIAFITAIPTIRIVAPRVRGLSLLPGAVLIAGVIALVGIPGTAVGIAIGAGLLSHDLLDGCTTMGVPFWWPLKIKGMRWRRVGLPRMLRFHTGGKVEPWMAGVQGACAVLLLPPVVSLLSQSVVSLLSQF